MQRSMFGSVANSGEKTAMPICVESLCENRLMLRLRPHRYADPVDPTTMATDKATKIVGKKNGIADA